MASRVRTRISFGAFANFKNNLQNQIGLNTIITSIKKLISTYNNNFAYIVNSFNLFLQIKYGKDPILIEDKESKITSITFQPESDTAIDYTEMLNKIEQLNKRVNNIEKIMNSGEAAALVTPGITFYFKQADINWLTGKFVTENYGEVVYYNQYFNPDVIKKFNNENLCYDFGFRQTVKKYQVSMGGGFWGLGDYEQTSLFSVTNLGCRYSIPNIKYFTTDLQIMKGAVIELSFGILPIYQHYYGAYSRQCGYLELCMRLDGTIEEFDESYKELKNGETLVL